MPEFILLNVRVGLIPVVMASKVEPSIADLLEQFASDAECCKFLKDLADVFPHLPIAVFTTRLGEEKGTILFNAAHPSKPQYGTF